MLFDPAHDTLAALNRANRLFKPRLPFGSKLSLAA